MKLLPHAIANGNIHIGTIPGKLKGVIPTQTPSGWRMVLQSIPGETSLSESPIIRLGIPQANSTIWMARRSARRASTAVFPASRVSTRASLMGLARVLTRENAGQLIVVGVE